MSALTTRLTGLSTVGLLSLSLAGCPDNQPVDDTGGVDGGTMADVPRIDAPGADVPVVPVDAPVGSDTPTPVTCTVTGYPALDLELVVNGLDAPVYVTGAPGTDDLFVVEKGGTIRLIDPSGTLVGTPFLDIGALVLDSGEQGLLGLAFHPDYAANGLFYVYYTERSGDNNVVARGTRATARTANPTVNVILTMPNEFSNHNGGCLQFGPDGELYIGSGDGGSGGDPLGSGQNTESLLGKILRVHVGPETGMSFTVPTGNPFAAGAGADEIWAYGVRNPWRFSFDRATGDFYLADVGQDTWEEVDVVDAGEGAGLNFGWNECEGFQNFGSAGMCSIAQHAPVLAVRHASDPVLGGGNNSITGGYVYRGSAIPGLVGAYLFSDYGSASVGAFRYCEGAMTEYQELSDLSGLCNGPVSFGEDNDGELYMVCINNGSVRRIIGG